MYRIKRKPSTIRNPQAISILERIHQIVTDMMRPRSLDMQETCTAEMIDNCIANYAWDNCSAQYTALGSTPGAAIFGRDMLFDIPYLADWTQIGKCRREQADKSNIRENRSRIDFDYNIGKKVLLISEGINRKAEDKNTGPYSIREVFSNRTVRIQRKTISERINIKRLRPYFK